jgi:uncharacterized membrane protein YozB (DUF420 family)
MEPAMLHAEMVLVVPVLAFTFLVMGWIMVQFRGYLKQREAMVADMEARHAPAAEPRRDAFHREAA